MTPRERLVGAPYALAVASGAVGMEGINASGTADGSTYLRGDGVWATPAGAGDAVLAATQTFSGGNTFTSWSVFSGSITAVNASNTLGGNGAAITNLTAGNISAGSLGAGVIASSIAVNAVVDANITGTISGSKIGSGVSAANIASGSLGSGVIASSIAAAAVGVPQINASGTADGTTFLRGDGTWSAASGTVGPDSVGTDEIVDSTITISDIDRASVDTVYVTTGTAQTITGVKTINADWVNTANPWADNEVADNLTISNLGSVDAAAIQAGSLGASVIASSIAANAVVDSNISGTISGSKIGSGVSAANIASGSLGSGVIASSIAVAAVGVPQINASGTPDGTTFLRGDGTWTAGTGDGVGVLPGDTVNWTGVHTWQSSATFASSDFSVGGSTLVTTAGRVGVSTAVPVAALGVGGGIVAASSITAQGGFYGAGTGLTAVPAASIASGSLGSQVIASSIAVAAVGVPQINATGTPDGTTYLRGDGTWSAAAGSGVQTGDNVNWTGIHTWQSSATFASAGFSIGGTTLTVAQGVVNISSLTLTNKLAVDQGGTGASDAATARTNLGAQPADADLDDLADGSLTGSKVGDGVAAGNIAAGSLDVDVIASSVAVGAVTDAQISGTVSGTKIGSGVAAANIASGSLGSQVIASSISVASVGIPQINASGTPDITTFLRGDGTWALGSGGDVFLAATQTYTGGNTFESWSVFNGSVTLTNASNTLGGDGSAIANLTPGNMAAGNLPNDVVASSIAVASVGIPQINASGTPDITTFLRGDGTWALGSGGDVFLAATQTFTGGNTFNSWSVFNGSITATNASNTLGGDGAAITNLTPGNISAGSLDADVIASSIAVAAVGVPQINATGTPDNTTFLRGDGTWTAGTGDGVGVLPGDNVNWTGIHTWQSSATFVNNAFSVGGSTWVVTQGRVGMGQINPGAVLDIVGPVGTAPLIISTGSTEVIRVSSTGFVGIGTSSPSVGLTVVNRDVQVDQTGNNFSAITVRNNTSGSSRSMGLGVGASTDPNAAFASRAYINANNNTAGLSVIADNASDDIRFYAGGWADANEKMRITASRVGISTNAPVAVLGVGGGIVAASSVTAQGGFYGAGTGLTGVPAGSIASGSLGSQVIASSIAAAAVGIPQIVGSPGTELEFAL